MKEFWDEFKREFATGPNPNLRVGQAMYNIAHYLYPLFTAEIVGTAIDPFYDDKNIPAFLTNLEYYINSREIK